MIERRESPRSRVNFTVHVRSHADVPATLKAVSRTGALILCGEPLGVGAPIHLHVGIPGEEGLDLMGRILRVTGSGALHEVAVTFSPLPPAVAGRFDAFVAEHRED